MGTHEGRSREIAEMLERRSWNIYCVQEARFRGKSVSGMISEKAAQYKLF